MSSSSKNWFVYMVRCADDTLYTGITTDVQRRVDEHNGMAEGNDRNKGAKYTKARRPVTLVYIKRCKDRSDASIAEHTLRKCSKTEKENLCIAYNRKGKKIK